MAFKMKGFPYSRKSPVKNYNKMSKYSSKAVKFGEDEVDPAFKTGPTYRIKKKDRYKDVNPLRQNVSIEEIEAASEEQQSSADPGLEKPQKGKLAKLYEMLDAATTPAIRESIQKKIDAILESKKIDE